mgnify:CR=1 FL=1
MAIVKLAGHAQLDRCRDPGVCKVILGITVRRLVPWTTGQRGIEHELRILEIRTIDPNQDIQVSLGGRPRNCRTPHVLHRSKGN